VNYAVGGRQTVVGWHVIGQSRYGSVIRQFTSNTPIFQFQGEYIHTWSFEKLHLDYAVQQGSYPANLQSVAFQAVGNNGSAQLGVSPYDGVFDQINISNAYRGWGTDRPDAFQPSPAGNVGGFFFGDWWKSIWCMSNMTGACVAFRNPVLGIERDFFSEFQIDGESNTQEPGIIIGGYGASNFIFESFSFLGWTNQVMFVQGCIPCDVDGMHIESHSIVASGINNTSQYVYDFSNSMMRLNAFAYASSGGHSVCSTCVAALINNSAGGAQSATIMSGINMTPIITSGGSMALFNGHASPSPPFVAILSYYEAASGGGSAPLFVTPTSMLTSGQVYIYPTAQATASSWAGQTFSGAFQQILGQKFTTTHGTNSTSGFVNLASGTATVSTTAVLALGASGGSGDAIVLNTEVCSSCGALSVGTVTSGTGFVINSSNGADASLVYWEIKHVN
jgi:hypothetical protein